MWSQGPPQVRQNQVRSRALGAFLRPPSYSILFICSYPSPKSYKSGKDSNLHSERDWSPDSECWLSLPTSRAWERCCFSLMLHQAAFLSSPGLIILSHLRGPTGLCLVLSPKHSRRLVKRQSEELTLINVNTLSVKPGN